MASATKLCQGRVGRGQKESGKAHRDVGRQRRCAERLAQLGSIKIPLSRDRGTGEFLFDYVFRFQFIKTK
jgi:hypothetical protein